MRIQIPASVIRLALGLALAPAVAPAGFEVVIAPAPVDRAGVVARFELPPAAARALEVVDGKEARPVQVDEANRGTIVIGEIKAGETRVLRVRESDVLVATDGRVKADIVKDGVVRLSVDGGEVFDFWAMPEPLPNASVDPRYLRGGHIHPVRSPSGQILTSSYPANHLHHHGIWAAWTKTVFQNRELDFWNVGRSDARVEFARLERIWSGSQHGGFVSHQRYVDATGGKPVTILNEEWKVAVYAMPDERRAVRVFDLESRQRLAVNEALVLPEYHYGGVGFRGRDDWDGANLQVLTSEGVTDRLKAHGSRVRWIHVGGKVGDAFAGVAVLGHPENFRAPEPARLHPTEPFLCFSPSQLGEWRIEPGTTHVSRYRYVVMDGPPDAALLDAYWNGYAHPATVTIRRPAR